MVRNAKIKWSDKDERELSRVVKNFNAKIARLEKKGTYLPEQIPKRASAKAIRSNVEARKDLNRQLNSLSRFTRKGAEDLRVTKSGVVLSKWAYKEAVILQRTVTTARRKKREGVDSYRRQESESLFDRAKVDTVPKKGFQNYLESLKREALSNYDDLKKKAYIENYVNSCRENLGVHAKPIIDLVRSLPLDVAVSASLTNPFLDIDFVYDDEDVKATADKILAEWQSVV